MELSPHRPAATSHRRNAATSARGRALFSLIALLALSAGCASAKEEEAGDEPLIEIRDPKEVAAEQQQAQIAARTYQQRLAQSPIYRSSIRDYLVANPNEYLANNRHAEDDFHGLASEFRCIHPASTIERAQSDGWELVKCDAGRAMFLRRRDPATLESASCRDSRDIPDAFETLTLAFEVTALKPGDDQEPRRLRYLYGMIPGVYDPLSDAEVRSFFPSKPPPNLISRRTMTQSTHEYVMLDTANGTVVSIHRPRGSSGRLRTARGWKVSGSRIVEVGMPLQSYPEMIAALRSASRYFEGD